MEERGDRWKGGGVRARRMKELEERRRRVERGETEEQGIRRA